MAEQLKEIDYNLTQKALPAAQETKLLPPVECRHTIAPAGNIFESPLNVIAGYNELLYEYGKPIVLPACKSQTNHRVVFCVYDRSQINHCPNYEFNKMKN